jgi:basic membrane lipoprotein Med (substrate-binding protein (PBP1-ABC) superfamily)
MSQGADVIYAAAGGTGIGVLQAAADAGKSSRSASTATRTTCTPVRC